MLSSIKIPPIARLGQTRASNDVELVQQCRSDASIIIEGPSVALPKKRLLLVSSLISMPYRVLRVAAATGCDVYVLGGPGARGLRYSRHCKRFIAAHCAIDGERRESLAHEINDALRQHHIDMVLMGDAEATRSVIAVKELVDAPVFPGPSLELFDRLNDKWQFTELCRSLGITVPKTSWAANIQVLRQMISEGALALPVILKPANYDGGLGVHLLDSKNWQVVLEYLQYEPLLVQEYIPGRDIGASMFCESGKIKGFIAHELRRGVYRAIDDVRILSALARISTFLALDGVYNFDMRLTAKDEIYFLECNPRVFFKIDLSRAVGLNFIGCALKGDLSNERGRVTAVRLPKALALATLKPWSIRKADLRMAWALWSDPICYLREMFGFGQDCESISRRHFTSEIALGRSMPSNSTGEFGGVAP